MTYSLARYSALWHASHFFFEEEKLFEWALLALQILIDNHMLTADEEAQLRQGLRFSKDDRWLALLYQ